MSGLTGVKETEINLTDAKVIFDPQITDANQIAETINNETNFQASVVTVKDYQRKAAQNKCEWYEIFCKNQE